MRTALEITARLADAATGLDIVGADVEAILRAAEAVIDTARP